MNPTTVPYNSIFIKKIDRLTLSQTGLILIRKKQETNSISFSEIEKIYIKKNKLNPLIKIGMLSFLLSTALASIFFWSMEKVLFSLFLYLPILTWIKNYKTYRLQVLDLSNTLFSKQFYTINKQEHIDLVNTIRKEIFEKKTSNSSDQYQTATLAHQSIDGIYDLQSLRVV